MEDCKKTCLPARKIPKTSLSNIVRDLFDLQETGTDPEHGRAFRFEVEALRQELRAAKEERRRAEHEKQSMRKELDRVLAAKQEEMDEVIRGVMVEMREGEEEMRRARELAVAAKVRLASQL